MRRFYTETGSVYDVDLANRMIRRVKGKTPPTDRVGTGWRTFEKVVGGEVGFGLLIWWGNDGLAHKLTVTSQVVKVEDLLPEHAEDA